MNALLASTKGLMTTEIAGGSKAPDPRMFSTVRIPDAEWNRFWDVGERRTQDHRERVTSEYTHPKAHELGAVGESFFAWMTGRTAADDVNPVAGDDGSDFPGCDVKAVESFGVPWLKVRFEKVAGAQRGFAFALVAVDMQARRARYCGYATKEMLERLTPSRITLRSDRSTAITGLKRNDKYGPLSYIIKNERSLIRDLPAGYCLSRAFLEAIAKEGQRK